MYHSVAYITRFLHLLVRWCASVVVDWSVTVGCICQYAQSATEDAIPLWSQRTAGWKPAGVVTCEAALTARWTVVVDHPWTSAETSCHLRRWLFSRTRSLWCWPGWRYQLLSRVVKWTCSLTPRSTLNNTFWNTYYSAPRLFARAKKTSLTLTKKFANFTSCVQFSYKVQLVMRCFTERVYVMNMVTYKTSVASSTLLIAHLSEITGKR